MNKKLKVLLVGCGGISDAWLQAALEIPEIEFVGLVDLKEENAKNKKEKYGLSTAIIGTNYKGILKKTKPEIVFDCTVPCAHPEVTISALNAGAHVLGEKPMAESMAEAKKMVATAKKSGKLYAVIQNRRYMDNIISYRDTIRSGKIGKLTTLNADFFIGAHFGGFREEMKHVLILDMAIHTFDQARFISGEDAVSVYCYDWNPKGSWYMHGASAVVIFEMTNGVVFTYRGSWCSEGMNTSWECEWRAIGTKGTCLWDGKENIKGESVAGNKGFIRPQKSFCVPVEKKLTHTGHAAIIREFIDCVKKGKEPQTICYDNIKSLAMVHSAIKSAETGKKVFVKI